MKLRKSIPFTFLIILFLCLSCGYLIIHSFITNESTESVQPLRFYHFNVEEAYLAIQNGELPRVQEISEEVFDRLATDIQINHVWTDNDFMKLQESILEELELAQPMRLSYASYGIPCADTQRKSILADHFSNSYWLTQDGFHHGELWVTTNLSRETSTVQYIEYHPVYPLGAWGILYYMGYLELGDYRIAKSKFNYLDIVRISDANGGLNVRKSQANDCYISIDTYSSSSPHWVVRYSKNNSLTLLTIHIDPKTGRVLPKEK